MSNGYFMPKNVFRGSDSNGTSYNIVEWDFATIATMDMFSMLFTLIVGFAMASIIAPIVLFLLLFNVGANARWLYIIPAVLSSYVIWDFTHRWLSTIATSFFANDKYMGYILTANVITLIISVVFILFSSLLNNFIYKPVSHLTEDEYNKLNGGEKKRLVEKTEEKKAYVFALIIILCFAGLFISKHYQTSNPNWLKPETEVSE